MLPANDFALDYTQLPEAVWRRTQLIYVCSPGNPTGRVMDTGRVEDVVRTVGSLWLRHRIRRVLFGDLFRRADSRRSARCRRRSTSAATIIRGWSCSPACPSAPMSPGMRSGFVAGDAANSQEVPALPHLSRLRHESADPGGERRGVAGRSSRRREPPPVSREIRHRDQILGKTPGVRHARRRLLSVDRARRRRHRVRAPAATSNLMSPCCRAVTWRARPRGINPGRNFVRVALVAATAECVEAAQRICDFIART